MSRLTAPFDPKLMPRGIQRLDRTKKGYPIPWFVDRRAPTRDGEADFRIMDGNKLMTALRESRCWVCGLRRKDTPMAYVAGPMCGVNRTSAEPPCHQDCGRWTVRACPFLAYPKRIRDERELPDGRVQAGVGIMRNPGVAMLWISDSYETWRPPGGGLLFDIGEPSAVEWYCEGRAATRAEVVESVETGLPLLMEQAKMGGPEAVYELGRYVERFQPFLPEDA